MIRRLLLAGAMLAPLACHRPDAAGLSLQPVTGTLTRAGQGVGKDYTIRFTPESGKDLTITALTDAQGRFRLGTSGPDGQRRDGVPEGTYAVSVVAPGDGQGVQGGFEQIQLPDKVDVKVGTNDLKLDLPAKK